MTAQMKKPMKAIEVPLNRVKEEAIPHHEKLLEQHKQTIESLMVAKDINKISREVKQKKRNIQQLKGLMYELDTLRTQVEDEDLCTFDTKVVSLLKSILALINEYGATEKLALTYINSQSEFEDNPQNMAAYHDVQPLQIQADISDLKVQQQRLTMEQIEALETDVEDLHGLYVQLNGMVGHQAESVEQVENNVEVSNVNIHSGLKDLIKSHKFAAAAYPVTGAFMGSVIGGPVGFLAGFKVGVLAAIGCGLTGFAVGKFGKKVTDRQQMESQRVAESKIEEKPIEKKDI